MKNFRPITCILAFFLVLSFSFIKIAHAQDIDFSLVSASELPPIESKAARKYLSGQKTTWPDGTPVVLVILPSGSPEMRWMCTDLIKMPEATYRRFIMEKSLRGGLKIVEVETADEAVSALKKNFGSVAPISSDKVVSDLFALTFQ